MIKQFFRVLKYRSNELRQLNYLSIYYYEKDVITFLSLSGTKREKEKGKNSNTNLLRSHCALLVDNLIKRVYKDGIVNTFTCAHLVAFVHSCYNSAIVRYIPCLYPFILKTIQKNIMLTKKQAFGDNGKKIKD